MSENKCPHCGNELEISHALYIEVCYEHEYAFDVFHGKAVEWGWLMGDSDPDDDGDFGYEMHPDWVWRE